MRITQLAMLLFSVALLGNSQPAEAKQTLKGVIKSFQCGDNCYLTIVTPQGHEVVGLCAARQCRPWNEETAIPKNLIGAHVSVDVGIGTQFDGDGNDMGPFKAFTLVHITR